MTDDARVARVRRFYEELTPQSLAGLDGLYAPEAVFKDPFNEVRGVAAIRAIFDGMYRRVDAPRFVITRTLCGGDEAFLAWDFRFRWKSGAAGEQIIRGATHIQFAPDGRVVLHRDYWDAAEELYEKLPLLGPLMRFLKRRARH